MIEAQPVPDPATRVFESPLPGTGRLRDAILAANRSAIATHVEGPPPAEMGGRAARAMAEMGPPE